MMGYRFDDIVKRIHEEKGIAYEEIERRVKQKLDKLSGLISKEGAAHIVANELGVDLISSMKKHGIKISHLAPGMRNVTIVGSVMKDYGVRAYQKEGREGKVASFLVGDESGMIRVVVWDTELMTKMAAHQFGEGCAVRVSDGFIKDNNGYREMHLGNRSSLEVNPEGVQVKHVQPGDITPQYQRKKIHDVQEGEFVNVVGTVVQVFEPRFYEGCSVCGRKVESGCREHGNVSSVMVPVLNFSLDDGTGNVPVVVFRDLVAKTLGLAPEVVMQFSQDPSGFPRVKQDFVGKQLVVGGKVQKNMLLDRIELRANSASEANPDDLLKEFSDQSDPSWVA